jgi:hypothetical protein
VTARAAWREGIAGIALCSLITLAAGGCKFGGDLVAAAAGGASGAATSNPAVGFAVAVGVHAAIDATLAYVARKRQQAEQDAIAAVVGPMEVGVMRPWSITHDIPIGNEHGDVEVTRLIATPFASCKEIVFSVIEGSGSTVRRSWYTTAACKVGDNWKWASAEPTVARWRFLQ